MMGGICHSVRKYAKANNKYMKNYNKNEASPNLTLLDKNKIYEWATSQRLLLHGFKWIKSTFLLNILLKTLMKVAVLNIYLKLT